MLRTDIYLIFELLYNIVNLIGGVIWKKEK